MLLTRDTLNLIQCYTENNDIYSAWMILAEEYNPNCILPLKNLEALHNYFGMLNNEVKVLRDIIIQKIKDKMTVKEWNEVKYCL